VENLYETFWVFVKPDGFLVKPCLLDYLSKRNRVFISKM